MKQFFVKLVTVVVLVCISFTCYAQNRKVVTHGGPYEEVKIGPDGRATGEVLIWDSYNDYQLSKKFHTGNGWIYGQGEASGNIYEEKATYIKREAQDAAYDQLAGQLARKVKRVHKDVRVTGTRDGLKRNDNTWKDGMMSQIKGELPRASMQYSYKIDHGNGNITYVVGVGIDLKSAKLLENKLQDEDTKAAGDAEMDDLLDF